jgi:hypothetical protein
MHVDYDEINAALLFGKDPRAPSSKRSNFKKAIRRSAR